ncbi:MAG TPA: ABC transporter ATP-binding protein [Pirellulaceae bacterium]|nr:ABC transporter ATP-binding protein [Pirellulaceae bacterium]HMO93536.1 ABC transporter ATP-binding protein [Pirellulaceae bacterium]HMP70352.1 ABC transporter ATP-binding protein [Pirellulaceae bacterium]
MEYPIDLENITKQYRSVVALRDISLRCHSGITGLLGPNGAGKSSLIKILMGLVKPSRGRGKVLGFDLAKQGRAIRSRVGYMPEDDCYISGMSGVEMVRFSANLAGLPYLEGLRRSHEILDFCDVGQERYRNVDTYSTGMRQKIKFAAAIVHDPELLILDEPTSGLDPEEREALLSRIRVLANEHRKAVLLSTHILPDVQNICEDVVIIARGQLRVSEKLETLNRTASPAMHVRILASVDSAIDAFQRNGFTVSRDEANNLLISNQNPDLVRKIYEVANQNGHVIQSMVPGKTSLEEVFISAVKDAANADS